MEYKYIAEWVVQNSPLFEKGQFISDICRWENQIAIITQSGNNYIHVNLESEPFVFLSTKNRLSGYPFRRMKSFYKHLKGAIIKNLYILEGDRVLAFSVEKKDIYSQRVNYQLIAELIPRKTNLILTLLNNDSTSPEYQRRDALDKSEGKSSESENDPAILSVEDKKLFPGCRSGNKVVECLKYITHSDRADRIILPNQPYTMPSTAGFSVKKDFISYPLYITPEKRIANKPDLSADNQYYQINSLFTDIYYSYILPEKHEKLRTQLIKSLEKKRERLQKKLHKMKEELSEYLEAEIFKTKAEIIKYNLNSINKGMEVVSLINYFHTPPETIKIELIPDKSPLQNMHEYFRKYRKSMKGREMKEMRIAQTEQEVESVEREMFDLINEVTDIKHKNSLSASKHQQKHLTTSKYRKLKVSDAWEVFIGRTAKENDELTCKVAKPDDWWFHSRIYQGSHIILRNYQKKDLSKELLVLCSRLAAYYSKAKHSSNVPVDYTRIRYVTKPNKSPAGYVIYKKQKTVYVDPISLRDAIKQAEASRE